jgi:hypothetical protein
MIFFRYRGTLPEDGAVLEILERYFREAGALQAAEVVEWEKLRQLWKQRWGPAMMCTESKC